MDIKPDSKQVIACRGGDKNDIVGHNWEVLECVEVLGWPIQSNGGYNSLWRKLQSKMWSAFWRNCRKRGWRSLGLKRRLKLLDRCVEPLVLFYLAPVPPEKQLVSKLNKIQRKMVRLLLDFFRYPLEPWKSYTSRASRGAASAIEEHSRWWALQWVKRACEWRDHSKRNFDRQ